MPFACISFRAASAAHSSRVMLGHTFCTFQSSLAILKYHTRSTAMTCAYHVSASAGGVTARNAASVRASAHCM